jgi:hypothetical protein
MLFGTPGGTTIIMAVYNKDILIVPYEDLPGGTTIVMAVYNNIDIFIVPYEDLPDEDKNVISMAMEEFQNKCLLSYAKTRDNKVI